MLPLSFLQSKRFIKFLFNKEKYEILGVTPKLGKRVSLPFLTIDMYYCEDEPEIYPSRGLHLIGWHVPKDKDIYEDVKKNGWFGPFGKYMSVTNPIPYVDTQDLEYFSRWSKRKRKFRRIWLKQLENNELTVKESDASEFMLHYQNSSLLNKVKKFNTHQVKELIKIYEEDIHFYLVTNTALNKVVAGMCYLKDKEINQLINQYSFIDKQYPHLGTGILDFRIQIAKREGIKYINWGPINTKGHSDKSWSGFTEFKLLFNPIVIYFRQSYFKITFNL